MQTSKATHQNRTLVAGPEAGPELVRSSGPVLVRNSNGVAGPARTSAENRHFCWSGVAGPELFRPIARTSAENLLVRWSLYRAALVRTSARPIGFSRPERGAA